MEPKIFRSRPLAGLGLVLSAAILAACNGAGGGPTGAASGGPLEPSSAPSEAPVGTPGPTGQVEMSIELLPVPSFDPSGVQVACDAATLGTGAEMTCDDIVALTARIAATMSANPIKQVAVTKPADNPELIQVSFWVQAEEGDELTAFTSTINPAAKTVTFPLEDTEAVFPAAS